MSDPLWQLLQRAKESQLASLGTTGLAVSIAGTLWLIRFVIKLRGEIQRKGWHEVRKDWKSGLKEGAIGIGLTALVWSALFVWNLHKVIKSDYAEFHALKVQRARIEEERDDYKIQADRVPGLEQQVRDLQNQKQQTITRPRSITVSNQPADEAEKQKRLAIGDKLGNLIYAAETIKTMCFNQADFLCVDAKNKWLVEALTYISRNLESSYEARFVAWSQPYLRYTPAYNRGGNEDPEEVNKAINFLVSKSAILDQFTKEFAAK